jgi:signal transduction histidine kinase
VREGFIQGGNDEADIAGMIRLYRNFRNVSFMAEAIAAWAEGDQLIDALTAQAHETRAIIAAGPINARQRQELMARVQAADERLNELERRFSERLGDASRTTKAILQWATIALALLLAAAGSWFIALTLARQQHTEDALRERNDQWGLAAQAGGIGVFDWNLASDRIVLDPRGRELLDCRDEPGRIDSAKLSERIHRGDQARVRDVMRGAIESSGLFSVRCRLALHDGGWRHVELHAHAREPRDGQATRVVGVVRDRSADAQAEQLRLDKEAAEHSARAKSAFLSRVSHELRTPLHAILGFAQLMQMDSAEPLGPAQATRVRQVRASGEQLLALVTDVLDLTRADDTDGIIDEIALAPVLTRSVEHVEPLRALHGITVRGVESADGLRVRAHAARLRQVLVNLLSNAIAYNRNGGQVTVRCDADDHEVRLAVHDTGPGLDGDQLARLFQPFDRIGAEYSGVKGSGLGLVLARQLLERMGGAIEVDSAPGIGSTFTARLRRA